MAAGANPTMTQATSAFLHPARLMSYSDLMAGLQAAEARNMVFRTDDAASGRSIYCYTKRCVYERGWDEFSRMARGLVVNHGECRVVATPFTKFFNFGEGSQQVPNLPFETFDKLDGSLIIIHHHEGRWRAATKASFISSQALWAEAQLATTDLGSLVPGTTYLAEAIYRQNRLVVRYDTTALVLLAAYAESGREWDYAELQATGAALGWPVAERHAYDSFAALLADAQALDGNHEGFVLRFSDGTRLKLKGAEYCRRHALIAGCNPLGVWDVMVAANDAALRGEADGDGIEAVRRDIPEEFHPDFDAIIGLIEARMTAFVARVADAAGGFAGWADRDVAAALPAVPQEVRPFIFAWRKAGGQTTPAIRRQLLRVARPSNNKLPGYVPSYSMRQILEDS